MVASRVHGWFWAAVTLAVVVSACGGGSSSPAGSGTAANVPSTEASPSPATVRPNIILIVTDDQRSDEWQYMPNVQKYLAAEGAYLPNFIITNPLCCPSRVSILRGQYSHNHGVLRNAGGFQKSRREQLDGETFATVLSAAGYTTGLFGKYLNDYDPGNDYVPPGWDRWFGLTFTNTNDAYFNYGVNDDGVLSMADGSPDYFQPLASARKAREWIGESLVAGTPFLAVVSAFSPHAPSTFERQTESLFRELTKPISDAFNEKDVSDKPRFIRELPLLTDLEETVFDDSLRARVRSLQTIDGFIADIIGLLTNHNALQRTYIMIVSDNGVMQGEHRIVSGKQVPYEESVRVGAYIRGPGVPAAVVLETLAGNIDLFSTFAEVAGAQSPSFVDGRSLLPWLTGTGTNERSAILIESFGGGRTTDPEDNESPAGRSWTGFRTTTLKYAEYDNGERELYDLAADPHETENLAGGRDTSAYSAYLARLKVCKAEECRRLEDEGPP